MRYTAAKHRPSHTFDAALQLKDAYLVETSAAAQVASANKIVDIGEGNVDAKVVVDVTAIEIASNDERYDIILQGSTSATFASVIQDLATFSLGAHEVLAGDVDSTTGRYVFGFTNEANNVRYRYVRLFTVISGAIAGGGGINFTAYIAKN
jgi:hypothetical protein